MIFWWIFPSNLILDVVSVEGYILKLYIETSYVNYLIIIGEYKD
jgi:hypothetical protein